MNASINHHVAAVEDVIDEMIASLDEYEPPAPKSISGLRYAADLIGSFIAVVGFVSAVIYAAPFAVILLGGRL